MLVVAGDGGGLEALLPLQGQAPSLLRPSSLHLARDDGQNAGTSPEHRRLRREGERPPGKALRPRNISVPASNLGMAGERFAQLSPPLFPLISALHPLQWLLKEVHRPRTTPIPH